MMMVFHTWNGLGLSILRRTGNINKVVVTISIYKNVFFFSLIIYSISIVLGIRYQETRPYYPLIHKHDV
jgi:hypothetical protein